MVTLKQVLEALAVIPEAKWIAYHYEQCVASWSSYVTSNDPNKLFMMRHSEKELANNVVACLYDDLGLQDGPYKDQPALVKASKLWTLAKLLAVREFIHQFEFYAALVSPDFGYLTNGHRVNPDVFHIYRTDPTSPTGAVLAATGSKSEPAYADLIVKAGRRTSTSRSFA